MSLKFALSRLLVAALFGGAFAAAPCAAQTTYTKSFPPSTPAVTVFAYDDTIRPTGGSPAFHRPGLDAPNPLGTLSPTGTNVFYDAHTFTVTAAQAGSYRIVCDSTTPVAWDNCLYLYSGSFNPASPLTNCIAGNNAAFGTGHSGFASKTLAAGTYTLVATSYYNGAVGKYTASVAPAANAVNLTFNATTTNAPTWNRPDQSLQNPSTVATNVPYSAYTFTAPRSATYTFLSECANPTDWDDFTFLYRGGFDASNPLCQPPSQYQLLAGNDDLNGAKSSGFSYYLSAGTKYVFVTTSATAILPGTSPRREAGPLFTA